MLLSNLALRFEKQPFILYLLYNYYLCSFIWFYAIYCIFTQCRTCAIKNNLNNWNSNACETRRICPCGKENVMRGGRKVTAGRWHRRRGGLAEGDRLPVCWILCFNWACVKIKMGLIKKAYSQGVTIPLRAVGVNMTTFWRDFILSFSRLLEWVLRIWEWKNKLHILWIVSRLILRHYFRRTGYSAKGKQRNDPVGNVLVRRVRKLEFMCAVLIINKAE